MTPNLKSAVAPFTKTSYPYCNLISAMLYTLISLKLLFHDLSLIYQFTLFSLWKMHISDGVNQTSCIIAFTALV